MISIAICDDEILFARNEQVIIEEYLSKHCLKAKISIFNCGTELMDKFEEQEIDLIFLDVDMPGENGMDIARKIRRKSTKTQIIFVTQILSYSLQGYEVNALRYLIKNTDCLKRCINESLDAFLKKNSIQEFSLKITSKGKENDICLPNLIYVESCKHNVSYFVEGQSGIDTYTEKTRHDIVEEKLANKNFIRTHKSYMVNLLYVKEVSRYKVELKNGIELPIAQSRFKDVYKIYIESLGEW
jgi:DNA-binding LytR/AlgR family response regulator